MTNLDNTGGLIVATVKQLKLFPFTQKSKQLPNVSRFLYFTFQITVTVIKT